MKNIKLLILAFVAALIMQACSPAEGEFAGSEYMPDMGHSLAMEANTSNYYYYNTWDDQSTIRLADLLKTPDLPVAGTIPRGYVGGNAATDSTNPNAFRFAPNGSVPYYYENSDTARILATAEILNNPFPITAAGLESGKELYDIYCGICHGEKGDGMGYLYNSDENVNAKYLLAPANLVNEEFSAASNGRYYHAIMYGKNVMGSYADKLGYEERWQVIHHIRALQAKAASAEYSADANTYNVAFGTPASDWEAMQAATTVVEELTEEAALPEEVPAEHHTDSDDQNH